MARQRSREKQSSKEDYPLNEQLRIEEGVFDKRTMLRLSKMFSKGIIASLQFIIARGKEADVYVADGGEKVDKEFVAIKIFRLENARFQKKMKYIEGDPRFGKVKKTVFGIVNEWCKKEYGNLMLAESAGVHAPRPYAFNGNVLAMEFIGKEGKPARTLREENVKDPEKVLNEIIADTKKLYTTEIVHADLSEYNILMLGEVPYMIDFGQAVHIKHPDSMKFLERDVHNLLAYFRKTYDIHKDEAEVLNKIIS